jgi:uncharacterized integral membrane protein (TIGR00697 family)
MNEMLWLAMLALNFLAILAAYKFAGKTGLYLWIPIATIVANIQVLKTVGLFGMTATLGNVVYATSFLVTDILSENYGRKEATRAVAIGFFSLIAMTVLMNLALWFRPAADDFAQGSLNTIFGFMPRIALASLTAYLLSQYHDVHAFQYWKRCFPAAKFLWLRNNASTMISQLIDTAVFCSIAFVGVFQLSILLQVFLSTYLLKWIVAVADTPFVYIARRMKASEWVNEEM